MDNFAWRFAPIGKILGVPNLSGRWAVKGRTVNPDKTLGDPWKGTLIIIQRWDKLRVRLETKQSTSTSVTAAILCESSVGWRLLYTYRNEPRVGQVDLHPHRGSADILFSLDRQSGDGEYFNGLGRFSFGTMQLTKEQR
ncbi:hypothetical protein [Bosea vaviloviae]|uniref:Cap15 family cyclic dinucleotide receptor domain-containing protein n=1 Tax=Bosea vaviloviae TaxID=1526658 RepID=UPI0012E254F5